MSRSTSEQPAPSRAPAPLPRTQCPPNLQLRTPPHRRREAWFSTAAGTAPGRERRGGGTARCGRGRGGQTPAGGRGAEPGGLLGGDAHLEPDATENRGQAETQGAGRRGGRRS
jgi:hypothetical protein